MNDLITEARELCAAATPGPWEYRNGTDDGGTPYNEVVAKCPCCGLIASCHPVAGDGDAAFIARSRTLIPALCDALEAYRWIPVTERLPEEAGSYLVYDHEWSNGDFLPKYDDYKVRVMRFLDSRKWCFPVCPAKRCEADTNRVVTHWMPLPVRGI